MFYRKTLIERVRSRELIEYPRKLKLPAVFNFEEHEPSYIHALYGEYVGVFDLKTHEMMDGDLPLKAQNLVKEWMSLNDAELQKMWDSQTIVKLAPLE